MSFATFSNFLPPRNVLQLRNNSDLKLIEGCLKGLRCVLFNCALNSSDQVEEIFKYTLMSLNPKQDLTRYAIPTGM